MRAKILGLVISGVLLCGGAIAQSGMVTLESRGRDKASDNYVNAVYSFEKGVNGPEGVKATRNDWDILFFSLRHGDGSVVKDVFNVTMVTDDRSRLLDLGSLELSDDIAVPMLPAFAKPAREKDLVAIVGHVYLVHTADSDSDLYTLFRLDELKPGESATITWRRIDAPAGK